MKITELNISFRGLSLKEDVAEVLYFQNDFQGVQDALFTVPQKFAVYSMMEARLRSAVRLLTDEEKNLSAKLYLEYETSMNARSKATIGEKAPTVDRIKSAVKLDPKRLALEAELNEVQNNLSLVTAAKDSMFMLHASVKEAAEMVRAELNNRMSGLPAINVTNPSVPSGAKERMDKALKESKNKSNGNGSVSRKGK